MVADIIFWAYPSFCCSTTIPMLFMAKIDKTASYKKATAINQDGCWKISRLSDALNHSIIILHIMRETLLKREIERYGALGAYLELHSHLHTSYRICIIVFQNIDCHFPLPIIYVLFFIPLKSIHLFLSLESEKHSLSAVIDLQSSFITSKEWGDFLSVVTLGWRSTKFPWQ